MRIRLGVEMAYDFAVPTPMVAMLHVRPERAGALETPDLLQADPAVEVQAFFDSFGNRCTRLTAPAGRFTMRVDAMMQDDGRLDPVLPDAQEHPIEGLPEHVLPFLIGSRYCETELLMQDAWRLFADVEPGWGRVQAICDFVHNHVAFDYMQARATRTAAEAFAEKKGVCRDYAHLAVALCRCMNIPARYCTGYISDIGLEPPYAEMDLAAWMEVWLDGAWRTFDPRTNDRRRGRVLMGVGRDAADVPLAHIFGPGPLAAFKVWIHRVDAEGKALPNPLSDAEKAMIDAADGPRHHPPVDAATGGPATGIASFR